MEAAKKRIKMIATLEHENKKLNDALFDAVETQNIDEVHLAIKEGADSNYQKRHGGQDSSTPLDEASYRGYYQIAKMLIKNGAKPSSKNNQGEQPLLLAAEAGRSTLVVKLLLENGADVNGRGMSKETPLIQAAKTGKVDIVSMLLAVPNIDIKAKDADGMTAMDHAKQTIAKNAQLAKTDISYIPNSQAKESLHMLEQAEKGRYPSPDEFSLKLFGQNKVSFRDKVSLGSSGITR